MSGSIDESGTVIPFLTSTSMPQAMQATGTGKPRIISTEPRDTRTYKNAPGTARLE